MWRVEIAKARLTRRTLGYDLAERPGPFSAFVDELDGGVVQFPRFELKIPDIIF